VAVAKVELTAFKSVRNLYQSLLLHLQLLASQLSERQGVLLQEVCAHGFGESHCFNALVCEVFNTCESCSEPGLALSFARIGHSSLRSSAHSRPLPTHF
jgi:hypothetical protein